LPAQLCEIKGHRLADAGFCNIVKDGMMCP
jgi:hypothetical protein